MGIDTHFCEVNKNLALMLDAFGYCGHNLVYDVACEFTTSENR